MVNPQKNNPNLKRSGFFNKTLFHNYAGMRQLN